MIPNLVEGVTGTLLIILPCVMHVQRRTVIDEKKLPMPPEQICIARCTINIRDKRIKPDNE
jgi:hypothetical protein